MGKIKKVKTPQAAPAASIAVSGPKKVDFKAKTVVAKRKNLKSVTKSQATSVKAAKDEEVSKLVFQKSAPSQSQPKKINKKEKILQRKENLVKKCILAKKQKKVEIARKNRQKTAVVGDMKQLKDALPSLDELFKIDRKEIKTGVQEFEDKRNDKKLTRVEKFKKRKTEQLNRVQCFESLLKDPDYKKNARDAIAMHIKYTHNLIE